VQGSDDIFVAKYTSSGVYQWAFNIGGTGGDNGRNMAVDGSGDCYVTGYFQGTNIDFDPGAGTTFLTSAGSSDIYAAKYDSSGAYQWALNIGGISADRGYGIAVNSSGNCYGTGGFQGINIDFDPGAGVDLLSSVGNYDIFVAQYDSSGLVYINEISTEEQIAVYPNPFNSSTTIQWVGNNDSKKYSFAMYDVLLKGLG